MDENNYLDVAFINQQEDVEDVEAIQNDSKY